MVADEGQVPLVSAVVSSITRLDSRCEMSKVSEPWAARALENENESAWSLLWRCKDECAATGGPESRVRLEQMLQIRPIISNWQL